MMDIMDTYAYYVGKGTTRKDYEGQELTPLTFEFSLPFLRKQGIKAYQLEVPQEKEINLILLSKGTLRLQENLNCL